MQSADVRPLASWHNSMVFFGVAYRFSYHTYSLQYFSFNSFLVSDIWFSGVWSLLLGVLVSESVVRRFGLGAWARWVLKSYTVLTVYYSQWSYQVTMWGTYTKHLLSSWRETHWLLFICLHALPCPLFATLRLFRVAWFFSSRLIPS